MEYTLFRSKRKTLSIQITKEAMVVVRAPLRMSINEIRDWVASKEPWIAAHVAERQAVNQEKADFALAAGSPLLLLGREYPLVLTNEKKLVFHGAEFRVPTHLEGAARTKGVVDIYKALAREILPKKVELFGKQMGLQPLGVGITSAKTRWGSCSGKNRLNFSWRLLLAEEAAVDYVVVHELAHIRQHNHSSAFWKEVAAVLPDYKERQGLLKHLQERLAKEIWEV